MHNYITTRMSQLFVPSLTLAIMKEGKIIREEAYGFRDLENSLKATPDTIYEIASITKVFTATAIMQLVEKGKISLDDPAEKYLPIELRVKGEPVRIWHLLSHTSGIPALGYAEAQISSYMGQSPDWLPYSEPIHVLRWLEEGSRKWAIATPGERFFYLNEGFVALGFIIEKVSGISYFDYIKKNIIEPLKLERTKPSYYDTINNPLLAKPYDNTRKPPKLSRIPGTIYADGGIYSSSPDLARFMQTLARGGNLEGKQILGQKYVREMEKPRTKLPFQLFGNDSYGLGLIIYDSVFDEKVIGHSGSVLAYTGYAGYISSRLLSIGVLSNANAMPRDIALNALALELNKDPYELPFNKAEKLYSILEGIYYGYKGTLKVEVDRKGDYLIINPKDPSEESIILEPDFDIKQINLGDQMTLLFKSRMNGGFINIEFKIDQLKDIIELIYERNRFVKVASLDISRPSLSTIRF
ncbi:MAG: serine hydrolase [Caldisphaeraceae archaeon]|nr:serine hydrolase [Caldisphaeraceae archaeon]